MGGRRVIKGYGSGRRGTEGGGRGGEGGVRRGGGVWCDSAFLMLGVPKANCLLWVLSCKAEGSLYMAVPAMLHACCKTVHDSLLGSGAGAGLA